MRVLHVINGLGTGGAERSLAEMLPALSDAGVSSKVVSLHRRKEGVETSVLGRGADVVFLTGSEVFSRVRNLRRLLRSERFDLVHTTLFESSVVGRLAAMGTSARVLTSLVNTQYEPARYADPNVRPASLRAVRVVDAVTARHLTAHFHAITGAVRDAAVRALGIEPASITVVERGRDAQRLGQPGQERRRRARAALGLRDDDQVVVNVGRQEFQKGQRQLLEAAEALSGSHPRLRVLVAGRSGAASQELEGRVQRAVPGGRVRFLGHREDIPEILAAADVFAFPSLFEGLGCSVIEAMALGLPIVASRIPALEEVLERGVNADLVAPGSPSELAAAIAGLLDDGGRAAAYGTRSRALFEERFTLERSAARMADLYAHVLEPVGASS